MAAGGGGTAEKLYVEDVFSTWLYTGNGSTQTITNGIDLAGEGGLVWIKGRSASTHRLIDTVRGATKRLETNATTAEATDSSGLTAFNSDGFTLGSGGDYNDITLRFASWTFRKAPGFFDVVTFTAGSSTNRRISHSLGSTPGTIIIKSTSAVGAWYVYHRSLGRSAYIILNTTGASASQANFWGTSDPTSTDFGIDESAAFAPGTTAVAYLFAHDAGGFGDSGNDSVSACGSFTTDGSGNATITLGWEPQWVLVKKSSTAAGNTTDDWFIYDTMRGADVSGGQKLAANTSSAESANSSFRNISATGFGWSGSASVTYIYIAIRRGPMKTPTDATKVFDVDATTSSSGRNTVNVGFPPDHLWQKSRLVTSEFYNSSRLTGSTYLDTTSTAAEATGFFYWDDNTTFFGQGMTSASRISYSFRRAPGFFDVVTYTGTGSATTVSHNLGVAPELMIVKDRAQVRNWACYSSALGNSTALFLNLTNGSSTETYWNNTTPTSSSFSVGTTFSDTSGRYIAYLFATCPGVSKVFNYTGTGTTKQIDCGFTNGARLVLIKRTDSTGDWYIWDSARGIVSGNDPYLLLNSTAAEVTNTDYIDPYSAGFEISSTAPAAINANGGSYIGLAIA